MKFKFSHHHCSVGVSEPGNLPLEVGVGGQEVVYSVAEDGGYLCGAGNSNSN